MIKPEVIEKVLNLRKTYKLVLGASNGIWNDIMEFPYQNRVLRESWLGMG